MSPGSGYPQKLKPMAPAKQRVTPRLVPATILLVLMGSAAFTWLFMYAVAPWRFLS